MKKLFFPPAPERLEHFWTYPQTNISNRQINRKGINKLVAMISRILIGYHGQIKNPVTIRSYAIPGEQGHRLYCLYFRSSAHCLPKIVECMGIDQCIFYVADNNYNESNQIRSRLIVNRKGTTE